MGNPHSTSSLIKFSRCFKVVLRVFQGNFKGISGVSQGWLKGPFKQVSKWFPEDVKDVSWIFLEVSRVSPQCLKGVWRKFQENVQDVSKKFYVAWHSSQLPEQKKGLFKFIVPWKSLWLHKEQDGIFWLFCTFESCTSQLDSHFLISQTELHYLETKLKT